MKRLPPLSTLFASADGRVVADGIGFKDNLAHCSDETKRLNSAPFSQALMAEVKVMVLGSKTAWPMAAMRRIVSCH